MLGINTMPNVENKTINTQYHEANILLRVLEEAYHSDHEKQQISPTITNCQTPDLSVNNQSFRFPIFELLSKHCNLHHHIFPSPCKGHIFSFLIIVIFISCIYMCIAYINTIINNIYFMYSCIQYLLYFLFYILRTWQIITLLRYLVDLPLRLTSNLGYVEPSMQKLNITKRDESFKTN